MGCGASQGKYVSKGRITALSEGYFVENHLGDGDFLSFYEPDEVLSSKHGDFGRFIVARHLVTRRTAAVQPLGKALVGRADLEAQIAILRTLPHPNIAALKEVCEDAASYYLVFDLYTGGSLLEAMQARCRESKDLIPAATCAFLQILRAVEYMHNVGVCHRSLSPDLVFLQTQEEDLQKWKVVITDFSTARRFTEGQPLTELLAANDFSGPEIVEQTSHTQACDIYACGAIFCALVFGSSRLESATWYGLKSARVLVFRMMGPPADRPSAADCVADHFFKPEEPAEGEEAPAPNIEISTRCLENMQRFCKADKLKKLAIHMAASHLSGPEVEKMREMFELVDTDHSGTVCVAELKNAMQQTLETGGYRARAAVPQDIARLMEILDVDGSATISYPEFIAAMMDRKHYTTDSACLVVFRIFDINGDGRINRQELYKSLKSEAFQELDLKNFPGIEEVLGNSDKDGDGTIDFEEFKAMMKDSASSDIKLLGQVRDAGKKDILKKNPQDSWAHRF
ncbi:unnamed protein product [Effrenium voratum]|nr:unnamed protein product [Effrenium voratum]CAJ1454857.1 unnamed protein product [Effrenium voratum]|mmetsp:Transcript_40125/g.95880  ORF Transcript_40125/g.95880 Transcript_40125/m.95880 type:complete len:513 (-) Transcript_40125:127-1665(-)